MNIDDTIKEYFRRGVKLFYETHEKRTMKDAFGQILIHFFHQGMELHNGVLIPILPPAEELPTLAQFQNWYEKEYDLGRPIVYEISHDYKQQKYTTLNNLNLGMFGPGAIYKIIAVAADIYLVSALHRRHIIGRPVIYLIVDVFSDLIVGMSVSLEGPNWLGVILALENMAQDKIAFCKEYGFDITEDEWPSHHLPRAICIDMEELFSKQVSQLVNELNIQMTNTALYQPDWKDCFERNFWILDDVSMHWLPDSVNNLHELGREVSRLDTCLTLYDFRRLLINCILEHNTSHRVSDDHLDQAMVGDKVEPYPRDMWKWGIRNNSGLLRENNINVICLNLLPKSQALVTQQGLRFHHLHYICDRMIQEQWFEQVTSGKRSRKISIAHNPQTPDQIYLCDSNGKITEVCSLIEKDKMKFTNCSWFDVEDYFLSLKQYKHNTEIYKHQLIRDRIIEEAERKADES